MPTNIAARIDGPAVIQLRGATIYSLEDIALEVDISEIERKSSIYGIYDRRQDILSAKIKFVPAGEWRDLSVLYPYGSTALGSRISPASQAIESIATATDIVTITAHGYLTGDAVLIHAAEGATMPTGVANYTVHYVKKIDADTFTLHPTSADADAGTNAVDFSDDGDGTLYVDKDEPCTIHAWPEETGAASARLTLHNAAVTKMPGFRGGPDVESLMKDCEIEGFLRNGFTRATANSIYTLDSAVLSPRAFAPSDALSPIMSGAWGSTAPWSAIKGEDAWDVDFPMSLAEVRDADDGLRARKLVDVQATAKVTPVGISASDVLTKLGLQGTGNVRGASFGGGDSLNITGPSSNPYVRLYGARLMSGPLMWDRQKSRVGQLTWKANRTFSGGTPNPLFYVGTAAPA